MIHIEGGIRTVKCKGIASALKVLTKEFDFEVSKHRFDFLMLLFRIEEGPYGVAMHE